jgi:hypothetical protein
MSNFRITRLSISPDPVTTVMTTKGTGMLGAGDDRSTESEGLARSQISRLAVTLTAPSSSLSAGVAPGGADDASLGGLNTTA